MPFSDMVRGESLRGASEAFTFSTSLRVGRAIGVLLQQRGLSSSSVLLGRSGGGAECIVRDGIVAGLVTTGLSVADVGVVRNGQFTTALHCGPSPGVRGADVWPVGTGILVSAIDDAVGIMIFEGSRPLVGEDFETIARLADGDECVTNDGGRVVNVDARQLPAWTVISGLDDLSSDDDRSDDRSDDRNHRRHDTAEGAAYITSDSTVDGAPQEMPR